MFAPGPCGPLPAHSLCGHAPSTTGRGLHKTQGMSLTSAWATRGSVPGPVCPQASGLYRRHPKGRALGATGSELRAPTMAWLGKALGPTPRISPVIWGTDPWEGGCWAWWPGGWLLVCGALWSLLHRSQGPVLSTSPSSPKARVGCPLAPLTSRLHQAPGNLGSPLLSRSGEYLHRGAVAHPWKGAPGQGVRAVHWASRLA